MTLDFSRSAPAVRRPAQHRALHHGRVLLRGAEAPVHRRAGQCRLPRADRASSSPTRRCSASRRRSPVGGYTETILRVIDVDLRRVRQGRAGARQRQRRSAPSTRSRWPASASDGAALGHVLLLRRRPRRQSGERRAQPRQQPDLDRDHPAGGDPGSRLSRCMFTQWALRPDSGGAGRASRRARRDLRDRGAGRRRRGGVPARRARQLSAVRRRTAAAPAALNRFIYETDAGRGRRRRWSPRSRTSSIERGQKVRLETPGGGGFGDPRAQRDPRDGDRRATCGSAT